MGWVCDGHGRQLLISGDWGTGDVGPVDDRPCPGCKDCQKEAANLAGSAA